MSHSNLPGVNITKHKVNQLKQLIQCTALPLWNVVQLMAQLSQHSVRSSQELLLSAKLWTLLSTHSQVCAHKLAVIYAYCSIMKGMIHYYRTSLAKTDWNRSQTFQQLYSCTSVIVNSDSCVDLATKGFSLYEGMLYFPVSSHLPMYIY